LNEFIFTQSFYHKKKWEARNTWQMWLFPGQKKTNNGKSANGKSAVQETKKSTDEQTYSQQICKCWDTLLEENAGHF
jgi:hypothetical protein